MAKPSPLFECTACGARHPKAMGKCTACGAWDTVLEVRGALKRDLQRAGSAYAQSHYAGPVALADVDVTDTERVPTGIRELDRVLGGGVVPGMVILLGGEPGIGKTSLVEDFLTELNGGPGQAVIARGHCAEQLAGSEAYLPLLEALENLAHGGRGWVVDGVMKTAAPTGRRASITSSMWKCRSWTMKMCLQSLNQSCMVSSPSFPTGISIHSRSAGSSMQTRC